MAESAPGLHWQIGAVGFCFGGGIVNISGGADGRRSRRRRAVLRRSAECRRYGEDQSAVACALRRPRHPDPSGWPAFETALKAANVTHEGLCMLARITASTTTRRRVTTRPPPSSPGSARWTGSQIFALAVIPGRICEDYIRPKGANRMCRNIKTFLIRAAGDRGRDPRFCASVRSQALWLQQAVAGERRGF